MNAVLAPTAPIQALTFLAINLAPLSDRMNSGGPRSMNRSVNASITSVELSLRLTFMVRASLVNSSMIFSVRKIRPHVFDLEQSHMTKHGFSAPVATGHMSHHSARADLSWAVFAGFSALLVAKFVRPFYDLRASHCYSACP